ncbi:hypothetical protein GCM10011414_10790 [Croceivirga lutea]|uniref:response regulator transcription factor n=1 Tax=Croceivirga lutea TaxID=1775167 RepID=UPI00163A4FB6|nr:response regulator [Croceivirga lutea]GGG43013.1 hypothetical protein GCM10011414_10790 [Croceivirga lutea]
MKKKILIVDDEPNIVMSLEYAFKKKDFLVYIARDGFEALEITKKHIPDVILLDVMMPQVDGYETLKILKSNNDFNKTKIFFLSAKSKESDIEKGLLLGADGYFTKPFSVKKIIQNIEEQIA